MMPTETTASFIGASDGNAISERFHKPNSIGLGVFERQRFDFVTSINRAQNPRHRMEMPARLLTHSVHKKP